MLFNHQWIMVYLDEPKELVVGISHTTNGNFPHAGIGPL